jgi:hypothetical protein
MSWYIVLLLIGIAVFMFAVGFIGAMLHCDNKMRSLTVGDLYITKHRNEPYLVAKIPMEDVAKRTYVTFEVRVVDDSQK